VKRSAIPTPPPGDPATTAVLSALKENVELLTGVRGDKLTSVATTATLADVIVALNKVIDRLS
jgi:hypothetical protein